MKLLRQLLLLTLVNTSTSTFAMEINEQASGWHSLASETIMHITTFCDLNTQLPLINKQTSKCFEDNRTHLILIEMLAHSPCQKKTHTTYDALR